MKQSGGNISPQSGGGDEMFAQMKAAFVEGKQVAFRILSCTPYHEQALTPPTEASYVALGWIEMTADAGE